MATARFPLRLKLMIMGTAIAVLPLAGVGLFLIDLNKEALGRATREFQLAVADDLARTVESGFVEAEDTLEAVGRALISGDAPEAQRVATAIHLVEAAHHLDHVAIYGADGALIDTIREAAAKGITVPEALPEALRKTAADPAQNLATGAAVHEAAGVVAGPRVPVVLPLKVDGHLTGFVSSRLALEPLEARVQRLSALHFENLPAPLRVVDAGNRVLAGPPGPEGGPLSRAPALPVFDLKAPQGGGPMAISQTWADETGREMVGAVVPLEGHPWRVVVQQPQDVIFQALSRMQRLIIGTLLVAVALALLAAMIMARRITAPLNQLTRFAQDLSSRRFDTRVTVQTQDELAMVGDALSRAAADLEESEARIQQEVAIRSDLGRYLPSELVEQVIHRTADMALGGRRMPVTVLFADVVAFTPLTDQLPPEEVVTLLNELFTILTEIVFRHGGTVDKFVGDCVMALWGAPRSQADHAARALAAAEEMMQWLEIGNAGWESRYGVTVQLAVGLNSGEAIVGNVGSEQRMEYTAIGDVVNVAARLEAMARPRQILISEATQQAAGPGFDYRDLGHHELAGRPDPVRLFEVEA